MSLQEQFTQFLAENPKWSLTRVAKKIGKSTATISQWKAGKYAGNMKSIDEQIKAFMEGQHQLANVPHEDFEYVDTDIVKQITKAARACEYSNQMRVVTGRWGVGKTTSVRKYTAQRPGVMLVECYEGITKKKFIQKLSRAAGYTPANSFADTLEDLFEQLKESERLIIIDEAEHLPVVALDAVRRIHDMTGCGVLLVGSNLLIKNLSMNQKDYGYIYNRCGLPVKLPSLSIDDVSKLVTTVMTCNGYADDFYKACKGVARDLKTILFETLRASEEAGIDVEKDHAEVRSIISAVAVKLNRREERD